MAGELIWFGSTEHSFHLPQSVQCTDEWKEELWDIIEQSGEEEKILAQLKIRLNFLAAHGTAAIKHPRWFEKLKASDDLYSLHVATVHNIRILFAFVSSKAVLLHAFEEKAGKRGGRNSYSTAIPIAAARLKTIMNMKRSN